MKKYKILALAIFACVTLNGWAQSEDNVTGRVLDEKGKPVAGALVSVEENPLVRVATDKNGKRFGIDGCHGLLFRESKLRIWIAANECGVYWCRIYCICREYR